jgi:hypothetical protein
MAARILQASLWLVFCASAAVRGEDDSRRPTLESDILPLFKARCVKCHGPAKREGKLNLATPKGLARGGKKGKSVEPGRPDGSLIWARVADEEMPPEPEEPLPDQEKALIRRWIEAGAAGLPEIHPGEPEAADHWAFARLRPTEVTHVRDARQLRNDLDAFLQAALEAKGLSLGPEADRPTVLKRVCFNLTGLPPTPVEIDAFLADTATGAYERMVERYLASPRYGERWGKYWLDAAGYADSNGYFAADTDRPLAYRYRDYVIRAVNEDRPFDRFLREQLAGDELSGFRPGAAATSEMVNQLVATHFLRNAPDGTGESDGNPDELRADRYAVLEGTIEILGSSLFGMTFQCARCHDHKFEPLTQNDYYRLQAILYPVYNVETWTKPNERIVEAALPGEIERWEAHSKDLDRELAALAADYRSWVAQNRERGRVLFSDDFDHPDGRLAPHWSAQAPGDSGPAGRRPVNVDSDSAPGAVIKNSALQIIEAGGAGNRWLSTSQAFDWTPEEVGGWVQVTFDLVERRIAPGAPPAERIGYYVALHDFDDDGSVDGGNILIDGNPAGGATVHIDYPGNDAHAAGTVGSAGYEAGHRFGVRITNEGGGKYRLDHLVDWAPEGKSLTLAAADLPDGGFGFEYCCGRSFVVDNVLVEASEPSPPGATGSENRKAIARQLKERREHYDKAVKALESKRGGRPGRIAWVSDRSPIPPPVHLLRRGVYNDRTATVAPGPPAVLCDADNPFEVSPPFKGTTSTGARLALANWITRPDSRVSALLARVTVNRIWQQHFGTGLVATPENLGYTGAPPSHPALLEYLAQRFVESGWSTKALHRLIVSSTAYRQSSTVAASAQAVDPENRLLWRYPLRRLDAEAVRDAMLAASGELDARMGGPYVASKRGPDGDVIVDEALDGAYRRSVYLQQRRTQVVGMLEVFDAPSVVTNCTRRNTTTIPLQSLGLLNSDFVLARAKAFAHRVAREAGAAPSDRVSRAFLIAMGRAPSREEQAASRRFIEAQPARYSGEPDASEHAWFDFCQMILASNAFLYLE